MADVVRGLNVSNSHRDHMRPGNRKNAQKVIDMLEHVNSKAIGYPYSYGKIDGRIVVTDRSEGSPPNPTPYIPDGPMEHGQINQL